MAGRATGSSRGAGRKDRVKVATGRSTGDNRKERITLIRSWLLNVSGGREGGRVFLRVKCYVKWIKGRQAALGETGLWDPDWGRARRCGGSV